MAITSCPITKEILDVLTGWGLERFPELMEELTVRGISRQDVKAVQQGLLDLATKTYTAAEVIADLKVSQTWTWTTAARHKLGRIGVTGGRKTQLFDHAEYEKLKALAQWSKGERRGRPKGSVKAKKTTEEE